MKKNSVIAKRVFAVVSMVIILIAFVSIGQIFIFRQGDPNHVRLQGFYLEDKNSLDIVLLGSSEVHNDFSSAEAYRVSGITSYPFGISANTAVLWPYELREIMKHQNPKLLIVELNGACYGKKDLFKYAPVRHLSDAMPLSKNKIDFIEEIVPQVTDEDKLSFYMPILKYHSKIGRNPLSVISPYLRGYNILRGEFSHPGVITEKFQTLNYLDDPKTPFNLNPDAKYYLHEFIDACKKENVQKVLFVQFPHLNISEKTINRNRKYLTLANLVTSLGYDYLDLSEYQEEMGIVDTEDYFDGEHLNARGQKKLTDWFMEYLVEEYDLEPTKLTDSQKKEWDESAEYIGYFYTYYEEYLKKHPNPKAREKALNENYRIIKALREMDAD